MKITKILPIALMSLTAVPVATVYAQEKLHPNVILIMTDDQGYGDLGCTGNPHVKTPAIDRLADESLRFTNFYVSPVCAPTRSSLMTGRFSLRTGVRDTYNGGAIMAPGEVTLAEMLKQADYRTGIFGKWHLGDNYPSRPMDQGFDESLIHLAGGMGQVGDVTNFFAGDSSYFNPVLWHNGKQEAHQGYCTDIFASAAIQFIERNRDHPFFCYLAFNAPHVPLQVPGKYYQMYRDIDPSAGFEDDPRPFPEMSEKDKEDARKVYAMVTNIDDNLDTLFRKLDELDISRSTVVIFMTDNGPQQYRYNAGMRGKKGSVYRGGVRVPFFLRYPGLGVKPRDIPSTAAHVDVLPTIAELCHVGVPANRVIDGRSLLQVITGEQTDLEERPLFFYWSRRYPELFNNMALQAGHMKLVGMTDYTGAVKNLELFDIRNDPYEQHSLTEKHMDLATDLKSGLEDMYLELIHSENLLDPPDIVIGDAHENPVILNRNDAGGERAIWSQEDIYGNWDVSVREGVYNIKFKFLHPVEPGGTMFLETKMVHQKKAERDVSDIIEMNDVYLPEMDCAFRPFYSFKSRRIFPFWVEIERVK